MTKKQKEYVKKRKAIIDEEIVALAELEAREEKRKKDKEIKRIK